VDISPASGFEKALFIEQIDGDLVQIANRELYAALSKQGCAVSYREYQGRHDFACWRGGVGDGLAALLRR
jgi:enterochelin esterase-like enzyme